MEKSETRALFAQDFPGNLNLAELVESWENIHYWPYENLQDPIL